MKPLLACLSVLLPVLLGAQNIGSKPYSLRFQPVFQGEKIRLDQPILLANGDSLALHTLRFYVGNFHFMKKGKPVFVVQSHHLLDLEQEASLTPTFQMPENLTFDSLFFELGVDSLSTASGAMGGDLDPTKGMFWTWQSGYINVKMEGYHSKCPNKNHGFEFHLGGYLPPFSSLQKVTVPLVSNKKALITLEFAPFFEQVDWGKKPSIMSPGAEAQRLSGIMAKSFTAMCF